MWRSLGYYTNHILADFSEADAEIIIPFCSAHSFSPFSLGPDSSFFLMFLQVFSYPPMLDSFAPAIFSAFYQLPPLLTLPFCIEFIPCDVPKASISLQCLLYSSPLGGLETLLRSFATYLPLAQHLLTFLFILSSRHSHLNYPPPYPRPQYPTSCLAQIETQWIFDKWMNWMW